MPFWKAKPGAEERIAEALEALVKLYALDLGARGLTLYTGSEEGSILETDPAELEQKEAEDVYRRTHGLAPDAPLGPINPLTGIEWSASDALPGAAEEAARKAAEEYSSLYEPFGSWGLGVGPEGAESALQGVDEPRSSPGGPPPPSTR